MNLDHDRHRRTGRTTRMLEHALTAARQEKNTLIYAADYKHCASLVQQLETLVPDPKEQEVLRGRITVLPFSTVTQDNETRILGVFRSYDYRKHRFLFGEIRDYVALIDHHALETHLADVIRYLRVTSRIANQTQWLVDTARTMATLGRRTYIITDDRDTELVARTETAGYNVYVEDGSMMGNLSMLHQELVGAHPGAVLLIEPKTLERYFQGSLNEINRWDKK